MCIISVKPSGVSMPSETIIRTMFSNNKDGAGYMIQREGQKEIKLAKGFMEVEPFLEAIDKEKINNGDIVIMHFRITTSGGTKESMCHPFVADVDPDIANAVAHTTSTKLCFAHNGVMRRLNGTSKDCSDTSLFAMLFLSDPAVQENIYESVAIQALVEKYIDDSRLALLHPDKGLLMLEGDNKKWVKDDSGIFYSNSSYIPRTYTTYGSGWYGGNHYGSRGNNLIGYKQAKKKKTNKKNTSKTSTANKSMAQLDYEELIIKMTVADGSPNQAVLDRQKLWECKSMSNKLPNIRRIYQWLLKDNPPKGYKKSDLIAALDNYYEDVVMCLKKVDEPFAVRKIDVPQVAECQTCMNVVEKDNISTIYMYGIEYDVCPHCAATYGSGVNSDGDNCSF